MPYYTERQQSQLKFLYNLEMLTVMREARRPGHYIWHNYSCRCRTCSEEVTLHTTGVIQDWLYMHRGHDTWLENMGPNMR